MKMGESDQYVLVHHEYAGLAGIEKPNKDDSEYGVSNQITAYLTQQTVLKLAVKTAPPKRSTGAPCDQQINYERDIAIPAIEKLLIPKVEKTLKSLYATSGEKIKNIRSTYKWIQAKDGEIRDYILVQAYVSNNANSTDVFEAEFFGRYGKGSERVFEVISEDALGRKKTPVCWAGVIFDPAYKTRNFDIRNATTGTIVASMELNSAEERFYEIAFYR